MGLKRNRYFAGKILAILFVGLIFQAGSAFSQVMSLLPDTQLDRCTDVDTLWIYSDADILDVKAFDMALNFDGCDIYIKRVSK